MVTIWRGLGAISAFTGVAMLFWVEHGDATQFIFFTTQSNILVGLAFLWGMLPRHRPPEEIRGAVTLYIFVTFIVFHLVLANPGSGFSDGSHQFGSLQNTLLHTVTPLIVFVDWVLVRTGRPRYLWALVWLSYPLAYLAFALIRGVFVHSYPYPFLDVHDLGYGGVTIVSACLFVVFWLFGLGVIVAGRAVRARAAEAPA